MRGILLGRDSQEDVGEGRRVLRKVRELIG